jgi:hypothetical protein
MEGNEITEEILHKNYILNWDSSHFVDLDADAWLVKFSGYENIQLALLKEYNLPEKIEFDAIFDVIQRSDFPINDVGWSIMSQKMLDILLSVGSFPHRVIPLVMVDCEVIGRGGKRSEKEDHRFVAVQLLEHLDIFDWEKSIYKHHPRLPNRVYSINTLVLKKPQDNCRPLFRLSAYPSKLFVSGKARMALEKAGIRGVVFEEI